MHKINLTAAQNKILEKAKITCAEQLIRQMPNRYDDCRQNYSINASIIDQSVSVVGTLLNISSKTTTRIPMCVMKMVDGSSGQLFSVIFFNQPYLQKKYQSCVGQQFFVYGKIQNDPAYGYQIVNPIYFTTNLQKYKGMNPVYKQRKGIAANTYLRALDDALSEELTEPFTDNFRNLHNLPLSKNMGQALRYPITPAQCLHAKQYFMLEDMLYFAGHLYRRNKDNPGKNNPRMPERNIQQKIISELPYTLTEGQSDVVNTLGNKMIAGENVNALIQGDVSCGKTITAFLLLIQAAENGYQAAIMAPTVVLASQHYDELTSLLEGTGLTCAFLNSSLKKKEKDSIFGKLASGEINIVVGTHSLTEDGVVFQNLGLIVIDEEQRFGVEKREKMRTKAICNPVYVSMSATPIPRTMASIIYGKNVDLFTIQSMPNGRKPVKTMYMKDQAIPGILVKELLAGRQAYVICPLIEENANSELMTDCLSVMETKDHYDRLLHNFGFRSEVLTGKMSEKEMLAVLDDFKNNKIQILISTTVVEVGVNNPNATVIVIQNAERFGLSSLHQLRGRVRRGSYEPYCILQSKDTNNERIDAMCQTDNGFELSKLDLQIRKTGDILGTVQSGSNRYIELMQNYPNSYKYAERLTEELDKRGELDQFLKTMDEIKGTEVF